jgi:AraC-like DNA-binding protein
LISLCFLENNSQTLLTDNSIYEKVEQVRTFIDVHYMDKLNLDRLAEQFFISKFHLSREFKRITGSTISNYILAKRIESAKRALRFSSDSVDIIARSCGFSDSSYFIKAFKKAENLTPNQYRRLW